MKQKKRVMFIYILLIIMILSLTGCTAFKRKGDEDEKNTYDVHTGSVGLDLRFVKDNPPTDIFSNQDLQFMIEVRNKGTHSITGAQEAFLYLTGFDTSLIPMPFTSDDIYNCANGPLEGKSLFNPEGGYAICDEFSTTGGMVLGKIDEYKPTIVATACYKYFTDASIPICVDPDPTKIMENEACQVKDVAALGGQGAPVAVSGVSVDSFQGSTLVKIKLKNVGTGRVVDRDAVRSSGISPTTGNCPFELKYQGLDKVHYNSNDIRLGTEIIPEGGNCQPASPITLIDGEGVLYCKFYFDGSNTAAFSTALNIRLEYGYMDSIKKDVRIINTDLTKMS